MGGFGENHAGDAHREYRYDGDRLLEIRCRQHDAAEGGEPEVIRFSYDSAGNLLSEETAQGVLQHRYDVQGVTAQKRRCRTGDAAGTWVLRSGHNLQQINSGDVIMSSRAPAP